MCGTSYGGIVVDMDLEANDGAVVVAFPVSDAPVLPLGNEVSIVFSALGPDEPVGVNGNVVYWREDEFYHRYEFKIDAAQRECLNLFVNRRSATRFQPRPDSPIMVEVHPSPENALSDGAQSLYPEQFAELMKQARVIAEATGRRIARPLPAPVNA